LLGFYACWIEQRAAEEEAVCRKVKEKEEKHIHEPRGQGVWEGSH